MHLQFRIILQVFQSDVGLKFVQVVQGGFIKGYIRITTQMSMTGSPIRVTHSTRHGTEFNRHLLISEMLENSKGYVNGNQQSIFDLITPTSNNGIYSYFNIKDTPISSTPGDVYARIIKMQEAMILVGNSDAYFTTSLANTWRKNWYKFNVTQVS